MAKSAYEIVCFLSFSLPTRNSQLLALNVKEFVPVQLEQIAVWPIFSTNVWVKLLLSAWKCLKTQFWGHL